MKTSNRFTQRCILTAMTLFLTCTVWGKSTLWKVTSKTGTLYLQGSVHMLKAEDYPLDPAIEKAFAKSSTVFFEVDLGKMNQLATQKLLLQKALLQKDKTLEGSLDAKTFARLEKVCQKAGFPLKQMSSFKPWFVVVGLTIIEIQKLGFSPEKGLDNYFYKKALTAKKKIIPLETIAFQLNLFDNLSKQNPNDFVNYSLDDLKQLSTDMQIIRTAWKTGDVKKLEKLVNENINRYQDLKKTFLTDRNKRWKKALIKQLKTSETAIVIVGSAHLLGKEGLVELLRAQGYTIEQL